MKTLEELTSHIKKHNDAVIIVGPGISKDIKNYSVEDFNKLYTRKNLIKDPSSTWKFYFDNIKNNINETIAYDLISQINNSVILDQNINGSIVASYLHGHINLYKCQRCKVLYPSEAINVNEITSIPDNCELCNGKIRPTVLLSGERYDQIIFDDFKTNLLNTHTVILIGMDYSEEVIINLIADFGDMKANLNAEGNPDNERVLVVIQAEEESFDPNNLSFCEFLVKGDINKSLAKLVDKL